MKLLPLALVLAATLVAPAPAGASVVSVQRICEGTYEDRCRGPLVSVRGSSVDLVLERRGSELSVRDRAGELTAHGECRSVDAHEALCPALAALPEIRTGDGDDRVTLVGQPADVETGAGADTIAASGGADLLDPGEGLDVVFANGGDDTVTLGDGRDERVEGGPGRDHLRFSAARSGPVKVDLSAATVDGERFAAGFQSVTGTPGPDTLRGTAGANTLDGGRGEDVLDGRAGDDRLVTGHGPDRAAGGPGDDVVLADGQTCPERGDEGPCSEPDGSGDEIACGTGADRLERARIVDDASGCERALLLGRRLQLRLLPSGALAVTARSRCACSRMTVAVLGQTLAAAGALKVTRSRRTLVLRPRTRWPRWAKVDVRLDRRFGGGLVMRLR